MIPLEALADLTAPGADRSAVLDALLRGEGLSPTRTVRAGCSHIVVPFGDSAYDPRFRRKLLVAHHDRAPGSPGALDNGAACLQLLALAARLSRCREPHNTVILFTDSEESSTAGEQGAFSVGRALAGRVRALAGEGEEPPAVFVFDVTGRGDTPILSTSAPDLLSARGMGDTDLAGDIRFLRSWASRAIHKGAGRAPISLAVPWSDDLGFALGGVPAVTITLLPWAEMEGYRSSLDSPTGEKGGGAPGQYPKTMPRTWSLLHGPGDTASLLEEGSFDLMSGVLDAFADLRIPKVRRIR